MPIFVAWVLISTCIPHSPTLNVNAVPAQLSKNQYCQWTFHCEDCSRLTRKFQGLKVVNAYENVFLFHVERQVHYLFVWDWLLLPKLHDILLLMLIWWSCKLTHYWEHWHPYQYSLCIRNHCEQMALLLFLHKPTRNCYNFCIQNTM